MAENVNEPNDESVVKLSLVVVLVIIAALVAISWLMTRGVRDEPKTENAPSGQSIQNQPDADPVENPAPTGGSTGGGTNTSNDPNIQTPSPAGGVDTNQVPAGE